MIGPEAAVLRTALLAVPGVVGAEILPDDTGAATLRLALAPDADEVGVARAVADLLQRDHGLAVDPADVAAGAPDDGPAQHRRRGRHARPGPAVDEGLSVETRLTRQRPAHLSVVPDPDQSAPHTPAGPAPAVDGPVNPQPVNPEPVNSEPVPAAPPWPPVPPKPADPGHLRARARIRQVQVLSAAGLLAAEVVLDHGDLAVTGRGQSAAGPHGTARAAAAAAAAAVADLLGRPVLVEGLVVTDDRAVLDLVVLESTGPRRLHGVAGLGGDPATGAVRAVLHAANRRLAMPVAPPGPGRTTTSATLGM